MAADCEKRRRRSVKNRSLLKRGFRHAGSFENPSLFVEAVGERIIDCGNTGNYMQLHIHIVDHVISDIKYLCSCEPTANVAVEVLCTLVKSKTLEEASGLTEQAFYHFLGSEGGELQKKVRGVLELLNEGITRYNTQGLQNGLSSGCDAMVNDSFTDGIQEK